MIERGERAACDLHLLPPACLGLVLRRCWAEVQSLPAPRYGSARPRRAGVLAFLVERSHRAVMAARREAGPTETLVQAPTRYQAQQSTTTSAGCSFAWLARAFPAFVLPLSSVCCAHSLFLFVASRPPPARPLCSPPLPLLFTPSPQTRPDGADRPLHNERRLAVWRHNSRWLNRPPGSCLSPA